MIYDKEEKLKTRYEVSKVEQKKLSDADFTVPDVQPVIDWDKNELEAGKLMTKIIFSSVQNK